VIIAKLAVVGTGLAVIALIAFGARKNRNEAKGRDQK